MKHVINNIAKQTATRMAMLLMFVLGITSYASADNVLTVGDLKNVAAGQSYELQFNLANDNPINTARLDFQLPDGLEIIDGTQPVKNASISHQVTCKSQGNNVYRVGFFSYSGKTIPSKIGKFFTITVWANAKVHNTDKSKPEDQIRVIMTDFSDANGNVSVNCLPGNVYMKTSFDGTMNFSPVKSDFTILPGNTQKVEFQVENSDALTGMQAKINLPQGLTLSPQEIVPDATRASGAEITYNAENGTMVFIDAAGISGTSGPLFSFTVKADKTLTDASKITLSEIHFTTGKGEMDYTITDPLTVNVKNGLADEYTAAKKVVDDLKASLDAAKTTINTDCKDVAAQYTDKVTEISNQIGTLSGNVESGNTDGTLRIENVNASAKPISEAIATMLSDAKAAQKKFSDDAAAAKKAANDAAYKTLSDQIAAAQKKLDDAKATIATNCKDVAAQYTETATGLQTQITALKTDLDAKNAKQELTAESTVNTADIETAIAKMLTDAQAAQKKFNEASAAAAQKAANDASYKTLTAQLNDVQAKLDAAKNTLKTSYPDVAANFNETVASIQSKIDAIKTQLDIDNTNIKLTADSKINTSEIEVSIYQLLADASAAQKDYVAKKAANDAAYKALSAQIAATQAKLDAANATIAKDCKDVAAQFTETAKDLQIKITALKTDLDAKNAKQELTAESTVNTADVDAAIAKMVTDAQAAQKKLTDDAAAAKKAANDAAYTKLSAQIAATQAKLDAANATIAKDCKDVAAQFTETAKGLQSQITVLKTDLDVKNAKVELTAESTVNTADVDAAIAKMVTDAQTAQKQFNDDAATAAKKAANDAAYNTLKAQLDDEQAKLDDAVSRIKTSYAGVANQFVKTEADIQSKIDVIKTQLENDHNNILLTADSKINTADIDVDIYQLLADASAAQKEYDAKVAANDAAYTRLSAEIAATQKKLDAAKTTINNDYAAIATDYATELSNLQNQIKAIKNDVQDSYIAVKLTAESQVDTEAIDKAITELLARAKAAFDVYTGINGVTAEQLVGAKAFYTLGGKKLDAPVKGQVNVVKMSDGTKMKLFIK